MADAKISDLTLKTGDMEESDLVEITEGGNTTKSVTGTKIINMIASSDITFSEVITADSGIVGNVNGHIEQTVYASVDLTKGDVIYFSGLQGNDPIAALARSNSSSTMPAMGIVAKDVTATNTVSIVQFGSLKGLDVADYGETGITFALGDTVYVSSSEAGKLTNVPPTGESNLIQNIGKIARATPTTNTTILVGGAGRTNATPNLDEDQFFLGNSSNQSVAVDFSDAVEGVGDPLYSPIAGSSSIVTTGAINSGSITSGFGSIDNGASAITTTGTITGGTIASTGNITVTGTVDGRDIATDGTKLDGIEASATADQTDAEIRAAVEAATDSNVFTDADHTKLNGIEASADVTDSTNVVAALTAGTGITIEANGTIAASPLALTTVQVAANESAQLALTAQEGDVVVRSDENKSYMHNGGTAGTMADYTLLATPTDAVLSVNGNTGAITADQIAAAVEAATDSNTFTDADHSKLNAIEANADVTDVTNVTAAGALMDSELTDLAGVKGVTVSTLQVKPSEGAFVNGDKTKLDGIEASADVTDATNVTAAGALMDSEVTNLAQVKAFDSSDYATAAQGTTADAALPKSGGAMTGAITTNSTFDGRDVATDGAKLDGIEAGADVTDATNVASAGAAMLTGATFTGTINVGTLQITTAGNIALDDSDTIYFGTGNDVEFFCNGSHMYTDLNSGIGNWYIRDGSTTRFTFDDNGSFTATSNITAYSDRKLKDNLEVIPNALDKVSQLTGYTYDRIDMDGVRQSGLIAQDVQEVLPEVIVNNVDPDSGEETLSVAYGNMIGLLVEAVKELKAEVEELKGK